MYLLWRNLPSGGCALFFMESTFGRLLFVCPSLAFVFAATAPIRPLNEKRAAELPPRRAAPTAHDFEIRYRTLTIPHSPPVLPKPP
jgi:hypothetical protein